MEGDILRTAQQIQAKQAAAAGLRPIYAGLVMAHLVDWQVSGAADLVDATQIDWDMTAHIAVMAADALMAALARRPGASS